jgi:hypothetical protein
MIPRPERLKNLELVLLGCRQHDVPGQQLLLHIYHKYIHKSASVFKGSPAGSGCRTMEKPKILLNWGLLKKVLVSPELWSVMNTATGGLCTTLDRVR